MNLLEGLEVGIAATKDNLESARVPGKPAGHKNVALKNGAQAEAVLDRPRAAGGYAGIALQGPVADQAEHCHRNVGKLEAEAVCLELVAGQPFDAQIGLELLC